MGLYATVKAADDRRTSTELYVEILCTSLRPQPPVMSHTYSYRWSVIRRGTVYQGEGLQHLYGDGPVVLLQKVLAAAQEAGLK
jgi:hypothetical protein